MYFGNLPEEFVLLVINPKEHKFSIPNEKILNFGIIGAILLELTINGRIAMRKNDLVVVDETPTDDDLLDEALEIIVGEEEEKSALFWIRELQIHFDSLKNRLIDRLVGKDVIEIEKNKKFWIFEEKTYFIKKDDVHEIIKQQLQEIIDVKEESNPRALAFLSLIYATNITGEVFTQDEIEEYIDKIRNIAETEPIGNSVKETIQLILDALMRTHIVNNSFPHGML